MLIGGLNELKISVVCLDIYIHKKSSVVKNRLDFLSISTLPSLLFLPVRRNYHIRLWPACFYGGF